MGNRRVILMLLAGIAACLLLLRYAAWRDESCAAAQRLSVLTGRPLDAVAQLVVERGDLYVDVRLQRDGWEMHAPFAAQVDQGVVAQLLDAIEGARITDTIRFSEMGRRNLTLRDFGLAPPVARVTLSGAGWSGTLQVGAAAPSGREVFVRDTGAEEVWCVPSAVADRLPKTVDGWRSRDLASGDRAGLRLLDIKAPGRSFIRLSKESGTWRLLQPADEPADDRKVEALLDALYAAKAARFVWPSAQNVRDLVATDTARTARMEVYGLGADAALQVTVQDAAGEPRKVAFGNRCDGEDALRYVLMPGGGAIAAVSNAVFETFQCLPLDLRDMRLFSDAPERVRRVEVAVDGRLFVLAQKDALWQMEAPVALRMDQARFAAALNPFLRLSAETLSERDDAAEAPRDLVSRVELLTDSGAAQAVFLREDTAGDFYRVELPGAPVAHHVAASNVPPAFLSGPAMLALCDRTVLSFADGAIRRVTVKRPDGTGEAVQRESGAESGWRAAGEAREVDAAALEAFARTMGALAAERFEMPPAVSDGADPYALKSPWQEITLDVDTADAIRKTLIIGGEAPGGGRYATTRGQDIVFVLDAETLATLSRPLLRTY